MTKLKRVIALALGMILILSVAPVALADAKNGEGQPGGTAYVEFKIENVVSLDGVIVKEADPDQIVESYEFAVVDRGGLNGGNVTGDKVFLYSTSANPKQGNVTLRISVNLKDDASEGSSCAFTFTYNKGTDVSGSKVEDKVSQTATVVVKAEAETTAPTTKPEATTPTTVPDKKPGSNTNTNTNTSTKPGTSNNNTSGTNTNTNTNTNSTTPTKVTEPKETVDYDALQKQIDIAKGLKKDDYDESAWAEFYKVLIEAEKLLDSNDQDKVDDAAKALEKAIAALVGVDHSKLREAIEKVSDQSQDLALSSLWYQMIEVLENAKEQLNNTDQAAVDAAAAQIENLLAEIANAEKETGSGTIIQEVPVEVPPTDDFCNITMHNVWPILFFISLGLNVGLAAVIIIYTVRVIKSRKDDTPLVDYDIDDDLYLDEIDVNEIDLDELDLDDEDDFEDLDLDGIDLDALGLDTQAPDEE